MSWNKTVTMVAQLCKNMKNHWTPHLNKCLMKFFKSVKEEVSWVWDLSIWRNIWVKEMSPVWDRWHLSCSWVIKVEASSRQSLGGRCRSGSHGLQTAIRPGVFEMAQGGCLGGKRPMTEPTDHQHIREKEPQSGLIGILQKGKRDTSGKGEWSALHKLGSSL